MHGGSGGGESPASAVLDEADDLQVASVWANNKRLVYLANFLHMAMYTMCLGGVFDNFLYSLSQDQHILVSETLIVGRGPSPAPLVLDTYGSFELTLALRPTGTVVYPPNSTCGQTYTCASSVLHITDGTGNGDCCMVGNRMPLLLFDNSSTRLLLAMDSIGQEMTMDRRAYDALQHCDSGRELPLHSWTNVKIKSCSVEESKGRISNTSQGGAVQLFLNGTKVCEVPGTGYHKLPSRSGAHVFLGSLGAPYSDYHLPASFEIKSLKYGRPASNTFVGIVNSVQGILSVALMFPIGWIGDRMNRYTVLKLNVFIGIAAAGVIGLSVIRLNITLLIVGICIFTVYQQCISSLLYAVLADNVPKSMRMRAGGDYKIFSALAMSFAPAVQVVVALSGLTDNSWTQQTFEAMLLPGWTMLVGVGVAVTLITTVGTKISQLPNVDEVHASPARRASAVLDDGWLDQRKMFGRRRRTLVAISVNVFFIVTLLANGMTVRYLNLYFTQILKFGPLQLCMLNAVCRLFIAFFVLLVRPVPAWLGRCNFAILLHLGSAVFTLGIYGGHLFEPNLWVACGSYFLRFACLHARDPVLYAITMDVVPPSQRSRWASLNSLRTLSFSASAVLGGYLADLYGYEFSFDVTVITLLGSTICIFPAWWLFPKAEAPPPEAASCIASASPSSGFSLPEPVSKDVGGDARTVPLMRH